MKDLSLSRDVTHIGNEQFLSNIFPKNFLSNAIKSNYVLQAMLDVESCHDDTFPTLETLVTIDIHPRIQGLQNIKL